MVATTIVQGACKPTYWGHNCNFKHYILEDLFFSSRSSTANIYIG